MAAAEAHANSISDRDRFILEMSAKHGIRQGNLPSGAGQPLGEPQVAAFRRHLGEPLQQVEAALAQVKASNR